MASTFVPDLLVLLGTLPGYTLAYGTNVFKGPKAKIPDTAGPFLSIIRTGGNGAEGTHNSVDVPAYERPKAQLLFRANTYDPAEALADAVYAFFWPIQNQFINGTWWRELNVLSEPFDLPPDEKGRPRLAFNIDSVKRTSPATS